LFGGNAEKKDKRKEGAIAIAKLREYTKAAFFSPKKISHKN
jgi:hypothetical protein